jgi:hypothetical protein
LTAAEKALPGRAGSTLTKGAIVRLGTFPIPPS